MEAAHRVLHRRRAPRRTPHAAGDECSDNSQQQPHGPQVERKLLASHTHIDTLRKVCCCTW